MATWKKILTTGDINTTTSLGTSNTVVPSQNAVKAYVDAQVDTADTINELADTTISGVGTGELLRYNGISTKWENKTLAEAGIQSTLGAGSVTTTMLANDSVTIAKMANMATDSFIGRDSAGDGNPEILSASTVRTILNVEDGATADQSATEIRDAVESASNSNTFTDADHTKLNGIESGATADQSNQEIVDALDNIATYDLGTALGGTITVNNDLTVTGDLIVNGATTTINTATLEVEDAKIMLANVASPSVSTAEGAGIELETSTTEADRASFTWTRGKGGGNTDGTGTDTGLTGWRVANAMTSNHVTTNYVAVMDFKTTSGAPTANSAGIGSFTFNTNDDALYVRMND